MIQHTEIILHFVQSSRNVSEDLINGTLGRDLNSSVSYYEGENNVPTYHTALAGVVLDHGLGVLVEGDESLLDCGLVVVSSAGGLGSLKQSLGHGGIGDLEVEDVLAGCDGLLELLALGDLTGISVNEESLGASELLDHGLGQEVEDGRQRDQLAGLHDGGEALASVGAGGDLLSQQVTAGEVSEAVLGYDLVALSPLAAAGATQHPHDGQAGGSEGGAVDRLKHDMGNMATSPPCTLLPW